MIFGIISRPTLHKYAGQAVNINPRRTLKNEVIVYTGGQSEKLDFYCFSSFFGDTKEEAETAHTLNQQLLNDLTFCKKFVSETAPQPPAAPAADCYNFNQLQKLTKAELLKLLVKETSNKGLIRGPEDVNRFFSDFAGLVTDWNKEHFLGLYLDTKNCIKHAEIISLGHLTASLVHPREVFAPALKYKAAGLIVGHNHPSGDPEPSVNDKEITTMLKDAGKILGVPLLDHIVFTQAGKFYSFSEKGGL